MFLVNLCLVWSFCEWLNTLGSSTVCVYVCSCNVKNSFAFDIMFTVTAYHTCNIPELVNIIILLCTTILWLFKKQACIKVYDLRIIRKVLHVFCFLVVNDVMIILCSCERNINNRTVVPSEKNNHYYSCQFLKQLQVCKLPFFCTRYMFVDYSALISWKINTFSHNNYE